MILLTIWEIYHTIKIAKEKGIIGMDKFSIEFYTKENGEKPAKDFLLSLDKKNEGEAAGNFGYTGRAWKSIA